MMEQLTKEEIAIRDKCRDICERNNKEDAIDKIRREYPGCLVTIEMKHGPRGMKMFMGLILYSNVDVSF